MRENEMGKKIIKSATYLYISDHSTQDWMNGTGIIKSANILDLHIYT